MVGIDIIEIKRIEKALKSDRFLNKVFSKSEIDYYLSKGGRAETLAGIFCAKEAAVKAAGCGFVNVKFLDLEVSHNFSGKPYLIFYNKLKEYFTDMDVDLSISHNNTMATAIVIATKIKE